MFIKWAKYYANNVKETFPLSERCAPSILITFINMVMFRGFEPPKGCEAFIYAGQKGFQSFLVILAAICVPWMLFAKPFCIKRAHIGYKEGFFCIFLFLLSYESEVSKKMSQKEVHLDLCGESNKMDGKLC